MGGVEGDLKDGLTKFKDNFNPMINELIGEFDIPVNKLLYNASQKAYNFLRNRNK
jgi:serine/alanine adding enzyme